MKIIVQIFESEKILTKTGKFLEFHCLIKFQSLRLVIQLEKKKRNFLYYLVKLIKKATLIDESGSRGVLSWEEKTK